MAQRIEFEGVIHEFPDDFSQQEIQFALEQSTSPQPESVPMQYYDDGTPKVPLADVGPGDDVAFTSDRPAEPEFFAPGIPIPTNIEGLAFGGQAVGRGLADVAGAPGDLTNLGVNSINSLVNLGLPDEYELDNNMKLLPGGDDIAQAAGSVAQAFGYPLVDPSENNTMYNMIRFGAGGTVGGIVNAARAAQVAHSGGPISKALTQAYVDRPARQVLDDTIAGVGAGAGVAGAEEVAPDTAIAPLIGALAGGMGASVGSRGIEASVRAPFKRAYNNQMVDVGGQQMTRRDRNDAATVMQGLASNRGAASQNIKQMNEMADEAGMTRLTTGAASDDVGLSAAEVRQRTQNSVPFQERDQAIRTDISESVNALRDPNADIAAPQAAARAEADRLMTEAKDQATMSQQQMAQGKQDVVDVERETEALVEPVVSQRGLKGEASTALDRQIGPDEGVLAIRRKEKNRLFEEGAGDQEVSIEPIVESINKIEKNLSDLKGIGADSGLPGDFVNNVRKIMPKEGVVGTGVLDEAGNEITKTVNKGGSGKAPLSDVLKVRRDITEATKKARSAGNFDLVDNLNALKRDINQQADSIMSLQDAQKYYREEYAPLLAQGYGKQYRDTVERTTDRTGKANPARIAKMFLEETRDAAADLKRIVDVAPDTKAANDAVERYMAADLARAIDAKATPRNIRNWISDRSAQLNQFPEIKQKFVDLQKGVTRQETKADSLKAKLEEYAGAMRAAEKNVTATERRINKGILGTLINKDPDRYIKSVMNSDNRLQQLDELKVLVRGNKEAEAGLKRAVTENLLDDVTGTNIKMTDNADGPVLYAQIARVMKKNEEALKKVYSPKEMNAIRRAQKMLSQYGNLNRRAITGSDTAEKLSLFSKEGRVALEAGLRAKFGVLKAGGIMRTLKGAAELLPDGRAARADRVVAQAFLDPEVAVHLLDTPVRQVGSPRWNAKLTRLLGASAAGRETTDQDEE